MRRAARAARGKSGKQGRRGATECSTFPPPLRVAALAALRILPLSLSLSLPATPPPSPIPLPARRRWAERAGPGRCPRALARRTTRMSESDPACRGLEPGPCPAPPPLASPRPRGLRVAGAAGPEPRMTRRSAIRDSGPGPAGPCRLGTPASRRKRIQRSMIGPGPSVLAQCQTVGPGRREPERSRVRLTNSEEPGFKFKFSFDSESPESSRGLPGPE